MTGPFAFLTEEPQEAPPQDTTGGFDFLGGTQDFAFLRAEPQAPDTTLPAELQAIPRPRSFMEKALVAPKFIGSILLEMGNWLVDAVDVGEAGIEEIILRAPRIPGSELVPTPFNLARNAIKLRQTMQLRAGGESVDPSQPIRTKEFFESRAQFLMRRADEGDLESIDKIDNALHGAALLAAALPANWFAGAVAPSIAGKSLLAKTAAFMVGEGLGGAAFGALRPTGPDETRVEAIAFDAALFAGFGGVLKGVGGPLARGTMNQLRRQFVVMPRAKRINVIRSIRRQQEELAANIRKTGENPAGLPPQQKRIIQEATFAQAMREIEPNAIDLAKRAAQQAEKEVEPAVRFDDLVNLDDLIGPKPREVSLPGEFIIERTAEFTAPPRIEPLGRPRGFVEGAGPPTSALSDQLIAIAERQALEPGIPAVLGEVTGIKVFRGAPKASPTSGPLFFSEARGIAEAFGGKAKTVAEANIAPKNPIKWSAPIPAPVLAALRKRFGDKFEQGLRNAGKRRPDVVDVLEFNTALDNKIWTEELSIPRAFVLEELRKAGIDAVNFSTALGSNLDGWLVLDRSIIRKARGIPPGGEAALKVAGDPISTTVYRSVPAGRDPLAAGFGRGVHTSESPSASAFFVAGQLFAPGKPGTLNKIRITLKSPLVFSSLDDAASHFGLAVPRTFEEAMTVERKILAMVERDLYDGIVFRNGASGAPGAIAFNKSSVEILQTLKASDIPFKEQELGIILELAETIVRVRARQGLGTGLPPITQDIRRSAEEVVEFMSEGTTVRKIALAIEKVIPFVDRGTELSLADQFARRSRAEVSATRRAVNDITANAVEPQRVTPGLRPPEGIEPTARGAQIEGAAAEIETQALVQAAVTDAVARAQPIDDMTASLKVQVQAMAQAVDDPAVVLLNSNKKVANALERALERESPVAEQGLALELMDTPIREIDFLAKVPHSERREVKKLLDKTLKRKGGESGGEISLEPEELINASWIDDVAGPATQQAPKLTGFDLAAKMTDDMLDQFGKIANESGFVARELAASMTLLGTGSTLEAVAAFNPDLSPGSRATLRTVGAFLILAGGGKAFARWAKTAGLSRRMIEMYSHESILTGGAKEAARQYRELFTYGRVLGKTKKDFLDKTFADVTSKRAAMLSIDEGLNAAEYMLLSPAQQTEATAVHRFNLWLGKLLKTEGIFDEYVENYISHVLPPETFARWKTHGFRTLSTTGAFTKRRRIMRLRDLETWATQQGLPGPSMELGSVQGKHIEEAFRAIGNARIRSTMSRLGLLQTIGPRTPVPEGMRPVRIAGMNKFAPNEVASALENIAKPGASEREIWNAADTLKAWWMRSIMFWFWEHGLNALRSLPALSLDPIYLAKGYTRAWKSTVNADPALMEAASNGMLAFARPDYGFRTAHTFEQTLQSLLTPKAGTALAEAGQAVATVPGIKQILQGGGNLIERQDRILWDRMIPALGLFSYQTAMQRFVKASKGALLKGTPEYKVAAREAADFANRIMGKVPTEMQNPNLARTLRLVMFSPSWSLSRLSITAHAAGELGSVVAGNLQFNKALHLQFKMRQLLAGVAIAWVGSKLMTGEEPTFNPNTLKYYMKTGLKTTTGKEVGVDLLGWWQDDLKLANDPFGFFAGRINPSIRGVGEAVNGRDFAGRDMTNMQRIENLFMSFGPIPEAVAFGARAAMEGGNISGAEAVRATSGILATGNVATLPRPMDLKIAKYSRRILKQVGIPANDDNVFELSRLLRGNALAGRELIDQQVVNYLGYRRRGSKEFGPFTYLFGEAKTAIWDLVKEAVVPR